MAGKVGRSEFGPGAVWLAATTGAILVWVGVAAPAGAGLQTFTVLRNAGVQRFDERVPLSGLRPGQVVELGVRATGGNSPAVTSIRIVRDAPGAASQEKTRCETAPSAPASARE